MSIRYLVTDVEDVDVLEDGQELEILFKHGRNGNNYVDVPISLIAEVIRDADNKESLLQ